MIYRGGSRGTLWGARVFKWWLLPHALTAACALLLGPFQFWDRLRQRHLKLHRVMGRIYVGGVMIGAPLGWYIQRITGPFSFEVAAGVNAVLLMLTTGIALGFALKGQQATVRGPCQGRQVSPRLKIGDLSLCSTYW